jgi:hypothetical protein
MRGLFARGRFGLFVVSLVVGASALIGASAQAELVHPLTGSFGPGGPGVGTFAEVRGVTVDQSSGAVYVYDAGVGGGSVYKFDAAGHPLNFEGSATNVIEGVGRAGSGENELAIDSSAGQDKGDIYVANNSVVGIYSPEGVYLGDLSGGEACGVAVDPSGNVYVGFYSSSAVIKYAPVSKPVSNADEVSSIGGLGGICNVAVDGEGNLYAATYTGGVNKYEALQFGSLAASGTAIDGAGKTLAADPVSNHIYIDEGSDIAEYSSAGALLGKSGSGSLSGSEGIAVKADGNLYSSDGAGQIDIFAATAIVLADVSTQSPTELTKATVTLNGSVNPDSTSISSCEFEYRTSEEATYTHSAACTPSPGSGSTPVNVSADIGGLTANTEYHYRLTVVNVNGTNRTPEETFATPSAVDALSTGPVEAITASGATLTGSLAPDGTDTHYYFEYGPNASYGSVIPALPGTDAGSGGAECKAPGGPKCAAVTAQTILAGLQANTSYDYRLVGVNSFGVTYGTNEYFTTGGPPRVEGESSGALTRTGAALTAQIDPDGFATKYRFEYGPTEAYGTSVPASEGELPAGTAPQEVSVTIAGLKVGSTYHFRVVASNQAGQPVDGKDQEFTTVPAVRIDGEFATRVTSSSASLAAEIDPLGADTTYYIQYGLESCVEHPNACVSVPSPEGDVGSGESDVTASVYLQGLTAATLYHYRVIARNEAGIVEGIEHTFTTRSSETGFSLPEGRQYEMVSPPNKDGAETGGFNIPEGGLEAASEDGSALTYVESGPIDESPAGNVQATQALAKRSSSGWSSQDIATPHGVATSIGPGHGQEYRLFSPDLSVGLVEPKGTTTLSPEAPSNERNLYLRNESDGGYEPLVTTRPPEKFTTDGEELRIAGASKDLSRVVFTSGQALVPPAVKAGLGENLYMWVAGKLQLVNVLPEGQPTAGEAGLGESQSEDTRNSVFDNGRVIWTWADNGAESLYVRNMITEKTVLAGAGLYQTASDDGSNVFFIANEGSPSSHTGPLDEFDVNSEKLNAITPSDARVQGVLGASEDGSTVYYVAEAALAPGASEGGKNLYVSRLESGSWKQPVFIATLDASDETSWWGSTAAGEDLGHLTARVSPDGRYVAFMSSASLTGYDNRDAVSGQPDVEVYLYDSGTGHLACASCDPSGARPIGELDAPEALPYPIDQSKTWTGQWLAAGIPSWTVTDVGAGLYQTRYLTDSGHLFFNSLDGLVPHDTNGRLDVYEYVPPEVSGCQLPAGCVSLISAGTGSADSSFVDASVSGNDVFFLTRDKLLSQDYDNSYDIYDAHLCSASSPCIPVAAVLPPPCSTGDACRAAPTPQPAIFGAPASATFSGAASLAPPPTVNAVKSKKGKAKKGKGKAGKAKKGMAKKDKGKTKRKITGHKGKKAKRSSADNLTAIDGVKR